MCKGHPFAKELEGTNDATKGDLLESVLDEYRENSAKQVGIPVQNIMGGHGVLVSTKLDFIESLVILKLREDYRMKADFIEAQPEAIPPPVFVNSVIAGSGHPCRMKTQPLQYNTICLT